MRFPKIGVPLNHHDRILYYKPSIVGYLHLWNPPYGEVVETGILAVLPSPVPRKSSCLHSCVISAPTLPRTWASSCNGRSVCVNDFTNGMTWDIDHYKY